MVIWEKSQTCDEKCYESQFANMSSSKHTHSVINIRLTFADRHALKPTVISVSVVDTSTVVIPSAARSATTGSAGFLELGALWACHRTRNR